jgi:hypothetical protein
MPWHCARHLPQRTSYAVAVPPLLKRIRAHCGRRRHHRTVSPAPTLTFRSADSEMKRQVPIDQLDAQPIRALLSLKALDLSVFYRIGAFIDRTWCRSVLS